MVLWLAAVAAGQVTGGDVPSLNAQTFRPSIDGDRLLWLDDAGKRLDQEFTGRFLLQYADDPLVYTNDLDETTGLVTSIFQADLLGGFTVGPARLGVDVPVFLFAGSQVVQGQGGLGDLALDGKVTALDGEAAPVDLAANLRVSFPTATVNTALGSPNVAWELAGIVSREVGPLLLATNLGLRGGPRTELENIAINDFFVARLGAGYAFHDDYGAGLELSGQIPLAVAGVDDDLRPSLANTAGWPVEFLTSGYGYPKSDVDVVVRGGVGGGLSPGIGSPDFRLVLGVGYEPRAEKAPVDTDGDGLVDNLDQCPTEPEDPDSWQDEDGCPDPDNDQDGILDVADDCINDPEDIDGWRDEEGCPDPLTELMVLVIDAETQAPIDLAKVGVSCDEAKKAGTTPFAVELPPGKCNVAATAVGYLRAEQELEIVNGPPMETRLELEPKKEAKIVISRERIELKDSIHFETAKAVIKKQSFGLLDEAVQILQDYPEIKKLRIEGHTDERGGEQYNLDLSKKRAAAVLEYFTGKGVDPARLVSEGYGESNPLDPGHNEAAWSKNRRVDFFIEIWDDGEVDQQLEIEDGKVKRPEAPEEPEEPETKGATRPEPEPEEKTE